MPLQSALGHKALVADRTLVWLDAAVRLGVNDQVGSACEPLLTRHAHVRTRLAVSTVSLRIRTVLACTPTHTITHTHTRPFYGHFTGFE